MSWFNTDYLNPESLHNVWFEIDEPVFVLYHNSKSQLCKDFQRTVSEAHSSLVALNRIKGIQMECSEDLTQLPIDYKILRLPCLILYDYEEKGRINSMASVKDLVDWMEKYGR